MSALDRHASLQLDPDPLAPREARAFVVRTVESWGLGGCADTVQLLTSELVTNGVLHAGTTLDVQVRAVEDEVTVEVHDNDQRAPVVRGQRADLLGDIDRVLERTAAADVDERHALMHVGPAGSIGAGRGLLLVETLADAWGVAMESSGKSVWFRVAV